MCDLVREQQENPDMTHNVIPQQPDVADHAHPDDVVEPAGRPNVAAYAATLLPAVLWLLGVHVFDGAVPIELQGAVGLLLTALCTVVVRVAARLGLDP